MVRNDLLLDDDDDDDDEPPPLELFYPVDYVIDTWLDHKLHGTWPEGTCYNDQDEQLMRDWRQMNARYNWWLRLLKPEARERGGSGRRSERDFFESLMTEADGGADWQSLIGE